MITKESLLETGFIYNENDPLTPYSYGLGGKREEELEDEFTNPELAYCTINNSFFIADPFGHSIYFNAESAKEAIEWANKITSFELGY